MSASQAIGPDINSNAGYEPSVSWDGKTMNAYLRFQTPFRCQDTGRPSGLFQAAGRVEDLRELSAEMREQLEEQLAWFNRHLVVPTFGEHDWRALFWFRSEAGEMLERIWDLVAILREEDVQVRMVWTREPGRIVYSDKHQIGAVPLRKSQALRV